MIKQKKSKNIMGKPSCIRRKHIYIVWKAKQKNDKI